MSFSIRHLEENGLHLVILREETTATEVALLPEFGASIHAFTVKLASANRRFNVIDNYRDRVLLEKEVGLSFKSSKLSLFPCRSREGKYSFDGKEYRFSHLFGDGNAIHGLLYNKSFMVLEEVTDEISAKVVMEYRFDREDAGYPYDFVCGFQKKQQQGKKQKKVTTVTNLDNQVIPIADGWHPYFQLGGSLNDWEVQFHSSAMVEFDEHLVPTGNLVQYDAFQSPRLMEDLFLDNCFVLKQELVSPACELFNPANGLRVSFYPDSTYPYLQLYTPSTRNSIAVENLSGAPDCFNNKMGLSLLQPGHSQIFTARYKVSVQ